MKELLIQYCDLQSEIKKIENRTERIHKQSEFVSDVVQNRIQKTCNSLRIRHKKKI